MLQVHQRRAREFDSILSVKDVINVLKSQFTNRRLYVKFTVDKTEIHINEIMDDDSLMVVTDPNLEHSGTIVIYGLSDKYIEVDLEVIEERGPGYYHCRIRSAQRAIKGRRDLRFKLESDEAVATNFKVSKHSIDLSSFNIPTSIKVVLEQFQNSKVKVSDIFKVEVFGESKDFILNMIKKTGKTLFVADTSDSESYKAINDEFIDLYESLGEQLNSYIKKNIERGYKSMITVPIIYMGEDSTPVPFGYLRAISKSENFTLDRVLELKEYSFMLVDRIRDANTHFIPVHQQIVDISRGGAKIRISDPNLKKYLSKSKGFIFDVVFKLQAPITIYGEIKSTYTDEMGDLYVGVDFEGNSSRKDEMKRFYSILKPMEADYKSRLLKSMKAKKKVGE